MKRKAKKKAVRGERAKKAAAEARKRRDRVAVWTDRYRPFIDLCKERFAFLLDHGFNAPATTVVPPECLVEYTRDGGCVQIGTIYGGTPWIVVRAAGADSSFGVHHFMEELDPPHAAARPGAQGGVLSVEEMAAVIDHAAGFLRDHAAAVLEAAPELVARLRARGASRRRARVTGEGARPGAPGADRGDAGGGARRGA